MLESTIERKTCLEMQKRGYFSIKLTGFAGIPDRLFVGHKHVLFVEFKRPSGRVSAKQSRVHAMLQEFGFPVIVAYCEADVVSHARSS